MPGASSRIRTSQSPRRTEATIRTDVIDTLAIPDTGDYALAAGGLKAERDKVKQNTIRLTRTNRVTPAGAA